MTTGDLNNTKQLIYSSPSEVTDRRRALFQQTSLQWNTDRPSLRQSVR